MGDLTPLFLCYAKRSSKIMSASASSVVPPFVGFAQHLRSFVQSAHFRHSIHLEQALLGLSTEGAEGGVMPSPASSCPCASLSHAQRLFTSHRVAYGLPPASTNVRLISRKQDSSSAIGPTGSAEPPRPTTASFRVATLDTYGLPMCTVVTPTPTPTASLLLGDGRVDLKATKFIVVDIPCAEAILRGADAFAPGILASCSSYDVGDEVVVLAAVDGRQQPLKGSYLYPDQLCAETPPPTAEGVCDSDGGESRALYGPTVVVGRATCLMRRNDVVQRGSKGVALRMDWNPDQQPSRESLQSLFSATAGESGGTSNPQQCDTFLQNWSSMVPVVWLTDDLLQPPLPNTHQPAPCDGRTWRCLDACAAPGGKTSLLLERCLAAFSSSTLPLPPPPGATALPQSFSVTACERSRQRIANMTALLESHFSADIINSHVHCHRGDVVQMLQRQDPSVAYDRIVLDPPCTGLGLRPKLLPHPITMELVRDSGEYQRVLFSACWGRLAVGGRMSYSTCTISEEENECNVRWALATFPDAELVPAETAGQRALVEAFRCPEFSPSPLTSSDTSGVLKLCCRFHPTPNDALLDGVGFFVALFQKRG